jgi:hypothetical protein
VKLGRTTLETAMGVLEALRTAPVLSLGGHFVLAAARGPEEAREAIRAALRE